MLQFTFKFTCIFSLPGRSPGRILHLTPSSESALASTFKLKFFKILYFPDHLIDWFIFGMIIDIVPKFYSAIQ